MSPILDSVKDYYSVLSPQWDYGRRVAEKLGIDEADVAT